MATQNLDSVHEGFEVIDLKDDDRIESDHPGVLPPMAQLEALICGAGGNFAGQELRLIAWNVDEQRWYAWVKNP